MEFSLDARTAGLSAGEFANFTVGPHDAGSGGYSLERAQLGTHWHNELRAQAAADHGPAADFEIAITGKIFHRGWTLTLTGRIDQLVRAPAAAEKCHPMGDTSSAPAVTLREIKTVTRALPVAESELRADYPEYFVQLATYAYLWRIAPASALPEKCHPMGDTSRGVLRTELVFVETGTGLAQTIALTPADDALFRAQLDRVAEFLELRLRARERLRHLRFRPPFATPRPGQETTQAELTAAFEKNPLVLFEAPTGFGKTGVLLEFALGQLRAGHFDRALYLTSKATGQLQVVRTLAGMTAESVCHLLNDKPTNPPRDEKNDCHLIDDKRSAAPGAAATTPVAVWHVRNKAEHCVNTVFHCVRESCAYLDDLAARWPASGLARFYLDEKHARDLDTLRAAGKAARICPYEITRAALAFNDVWIGDYNYVFAPRNRRLFFDQPGFDPARTLLLLDEAHNLPSRVADAYSHLALAGDARALLAELDHLSAAAPLLRAWESWTHLLAALQPVDQLDPALEADAADTLEKIVALLELAPPDASALGPRFAETLWQTPALSEWLANPALKKLLWCPRAGELAFTCLDAAEAIGESLRLFGGAVFASATLSPTDAFAESTGLQDFGNRTPASAKATAVRPETGKRLPPAESGGAELSGFRFPPSGIVHLRAHTPWRDGAYDIAVDARVDTTFQQRARYFPATAATISALQDSAGGPVAVFFPSYAYAESIAREFERPASGLSPLRVALQPRLRDLAAQSAWVEESLAFADALFLVLGSSFAESIDALGGRITHAMVVGPALPEVNAVQRARLAEHAALGREGAFRRVYQIPGMTKVNQALGRLVRAPGQHARVILHCRRFLEPSYASLLAPEYQFGVNVADDVALAAWLKN